MISLKQVRPADENDRRRTGRICRIIRCVALTTLISAAATPAEQLFAPVKLSLGPLPAPRATITDTNHFTLAIEPLPKTSPTTGGISAWSSDATRRDLEAVTALKNQSIAAKAAHRGLFSTQVGDRGFRIANIQTGYGMVCMDPVYTRRHNGTAMEEPCFLFVKTSFKF